MKHKTFSKGAGASESSRFIPCPICGGSRFKTLWKNTLPQWKRCCRCSLVLQNPQPLTADILRRYDRQYYDYEIKNEQGFLNLMLAGLQDISFFNWAQGPDRSFLDVGCATGRLADYMNRRGWQARGVEVCREAAEWGRKNYNVEIFSGTLEEAAFPDESFRFVHTSHVIEHINEPGLFLDEIYRILKPDGFFLCVTPDISGFQARLFKSRWRSVIDDHLFLFSGKTLKGLALQHGFKRLGIKTWGGLGAGYAPKSIKKIADVLVKPLGLGDVMFQVFHKVS